MPSYDPEGQECWKGTDKAQANAEADRLGYPVLVNGEHFAKKVGAMAAISAVPKDEEITVARPGPTLEE